MGVGGENGPSCSTLSSGVGVEALKSTESPHTILTEDGYFAGGIVETLNERKRRRMEVDAHS
jgi:hypothetical protein